MDLFDKCKTADGYFGDLRLINDEYFTKPVLDSLPGPHMDFMGVPSIMWSVNNYLGLAQNEEIKKVAEETLVDHSISSPMGSRMLTGTTSVHKEFEQRLAAFSEKESAILFNYGYLGVMGTIASLTGPDDVVIMDKLAHASIVDGTFLSQAQFRVFRHNDMDSLEALLKRVNRDRKGGILIVIEGTYGMTGDLANMVDICRLKDEYGARLFVDDAHGIGVLGQKGMGIGEYFDVQDKIDIYFGTFAKSFASIGGFSAGPREVIDWIRYNARTQVFAKSLPMVYVKSLMKTLDMIKNGQDRREKMWTIANRIKDGLRDLGYYVGPGKAPICPVFTTLPEEIQVEAGKKMVTFLRNNGVYVSPVAYPVIPRGLIMFRMIPTAAHSIEDVDQTLKIFKQMKEEMDFDLSVSDDQIKKIGALFSGNI